MSQYADVIVTALGAITAFLVWLQLRTQTTLRDKDAKLKTIENKQSIQQAEADQQKAQLEIVRELAAGAFKSQETWQSVVNTMSERRRESDTEISRALKENAQAVSNLSSVLEIQVTTYSNFKTVVEDSLRAFVLSADATYKSVDSQKEELTLVQQAIKTLTTRIDDMIDLEEKHILSQDERHNSLKTDNQGQKTELVSINDALKTMNMILQKILGRMEVTPLIQPVDDVSIDIIPVAEIAAPVAAEETKP